MRQRGFTVPLMMRWPSANCGTARLRKGPFLRMGVNRAIHGRFAFTGAESLGFTRFNDSGPLRPIQSGWADLTDSKRGVLCPTPPTLPSRRYIPAQ